MHMWKSFQMDAIFFHLLLSFLYIFSSNICQARQDCLAVKGNFRCDYRTAVYVKLVDHDRFSQDDDIDEMCRATVSRGCFNLKGCASDPVTSIDPEIHVYHQCRSGGQTKRLRLVVPKAAIGKTYTFDQEIDLNDGTDGSLGREENLVNFPAMSEKCRQTAASIE